MNEVSNWQRRLKVTAHHILEVLARGLYRDAPACLWELVKNALVACMPGGVWRPKLGRVEIFLHDNHPMAPGTKCLIVLDHGSGFTSEKTDRYTTLGREIGDDQVEHSGAADKRTGRWSGLALNSRCLVQRDITTGFFIFTRTAADGPVTLVPIIPGEIERNGMSAKSVSANATELGPQKGIKGSFTAIVIPNSVFGSYDEIREALKWRLPRKPDQAVSLQVGGKVLMAPPLAKEESVLQANGKIEAFLAKAKNPEIDGGVYLTDAATGLRVAACTEMGRRLPPPLSLFSISGDIFLPNLLEYQDTGRSGMANRYFASDEWKKAMPFIIGQILPKAKDLVGHEYDFGSDPVSSSLRGLVDICRRAWPNPTPHTPAGKPKPASGGGHGGGTGNGNGPRKDVIKIPIGGKEYLCSNLPSDPRVLAEIHQHNPEVIWINNRYAALPKEKAARDEHVLLAVLYSVARSQFAKDPDKMKWAVGEWRAKLLEVK